MRIALLSSLGITLDSFFPEIVDEWNRMGSSVVSAASTMSRVGEFTELPAVTRQPSLRNLRAPSEIRAWLRRTEADVLLTNTATASALARLGSLPVPVVYFCHGLHWNEGTSAPDRMWQFVESSLARKTSGVISINSDDESWFRKRLGAKQVLRLMLGVGVPLTSYRPAVMPQGAATTLLWVGEFSPRKQPLQAVEVISAIRATGADVRLVMLGDGYLYEDVRRHVAEARLTEYISMPGRGDFVGYMTECHALLHTAQWEGLPRVMLEAHAMGRRSYAYDVKGVRDVPNATLVAQLQPELLAGALSRDILSGRIRDPIPTLDGLDTSNSAHLIHDFLGRRIGSTLRGRN